MRYQLRYSRIDHDDCSTEWGMVQAYISFQVCQTFFRSGERGHRTRSGASETLALPGPPPGVNT